MIAGTWSSLLGLLRARFIALTGSAPENGLHLALSPVAQLPPGLQPTDIPWENIVQRQAPAGSTSASNPPATELINQPDMSPSAAMATKTPRCPTGPLPAAVEGFEIISVLGRGGMGVVYKARQIKLNRLVALKMVLTGAHACSEDLLRFRIEAEAVALLHHPHIVQIYDIGEHDGRPFFALEYVDGDNLADRLARGAPAIAEAAQLVETLARAVHHAHERGVIHRDLKPANILLALSSQHSALSSQHSALSTLVPKITDFGLAKRLGHDTAGTRTGGAMGTPCYMAPEQAWGRSDEISTATDVYSLGAILYEMLTGWPPFRAKTPLETLVEAATQEPVAPHLLRPDVSPDLETICLKCLQKEPAARYVSAESLADDLRRFLHGEPIGARPVSGAERVWRWSRRNPALASAFATVAALLVMTAVGASLAAWQFAAMAQRTQEAAEREHEALQQADKDRQDAHAAHLQALEALQNEKKARDEAEKARYEAEEALREANVAKRKQAEMKAKLIIEENEHRRVLTQLHKELFGQLIKPPSAAQGKLTPAELVRMRAEAEKAIRLAPTYPAGFVRLGNVLLQEARQEPRRDLQIVKLAEAIQHYEDAVKLFQGMEDPDKELPELHFIRSKAYFDLAFLETHKEQQKAYFIKSLNDADVALRSGYTPRQYALAARGIALENLAWLASEKPHYAEAVAAYSEAIHLNDGDPKPLIDRGRCLYKRAVWGGENAYLQAARQDLENAFLKKLTRVEYLEVSYWLGNLYWRAGSNDIKLADRLLQQAVEVAEKERSLGWQRVALSARAQLALFRYHGVSQSESAEEFLKTGRTCAVKLSEISPEPQDQTFALEAAHILRDIGLAYERRQQPREALRSYQTALPAELRKTAAAHVPLLNATNRLFTAPSWQTILREEKPSVAGLIRAAERAVALCQDPLVPPLDQAEAYGAAGLCYQDAAAHSDTPDVQRQSYRDRSLLLLEQAVRGGPLSPWRWTWHKAIGEQYLVQLKRTADAERKVRYFDKARTNLSEALQVASSNQLIVSIIRSVQKELDENKPRAEKN